MIGSLMSRMGDAQKLSIPQLHQAVQDGTLPAYIGIPLLQDKMQQQKAAQNPQPQQQAPIAQQIMQETGPQAQPQGIDTAQSNLPEAGMAGGGIVAFADGGLNEDDEDDADAEKQDLAMFRKMIAQMEEAPDLEEDGEEVAPAAYSMSAAPSKGVGIDIEKRGASEGIKSSHKYTELARKAAEKAGVSERLMLHVLNKETGGLKDPEQARSSAGAQGIMQFMPATAKQYGINPDSPEQAVQGGARMLSDLTKHYKGDEKLAAMAYNWGMGNVDKWLASGGDEARLPGETRKYSMGLAQGGIVAFDEGGEAEDKQKESDREDFLTGLKKLGASAADVVTLPVRGVMGAVNTGIRAGRAATGVDIPYIPEEAFGGSSESMTPYYDKYVRKHELAKEEVNKPIAPKFSPEELQKQQIAENEPNPSDKPSWETEPEKEAAPATTKSEDELASMQDMLKERMASSKNQRSIDNYMSLLQAGLGMMGGTSPYAMTNIGQGASKGITHLAEARKAQIADENAILSGRLGLSRAQLYEQTRKDALARQVANDKLMAEHRKATLGLGYLKAGEQQKANALKAQKQYTDQGLDKLLQKKYEDKHGKNFMVDPILQHQFKQEMQQEIGNLSTIVGAEQSASGVPSNSSLQ